MSIVKRFVAFLSLFALFTNQVLAATWYIDSSSDMDMDTCVADEYDLDDDCNFRDALSQAVSGDDIIFASNYNIVNTGGTYNVTQDNLTINGNGILNGGSSGVDGVYITGDNVTLMNSLSVVGGFDNGIVIGSGADGTYLNGIYVGLENYGNDPNGVDGNGVVVYGTNTDIASSYFGDNGENGILVDGASDFNFTYNNSGTSTYGNAQNGILLQGAISGTNAITGGGLRNNTDDGLRIGSGAMSGTLNVSGVSIYNSFGVNNGGHGINGQANASNAMNINIGGSGFSDKNVIGLNGGDGIHIEDCGALTIVGNAIGVDSSAFSDYGNSGDGIDVDCDTVLIGTNLDGSNDNNEKNIVSNNGGYGINLNGDSVTTAIINGNFVGTDGQAGHAFTTFGNDLGGIEVNSSALTSLTIGSATNSYGNNRILDNGGGVRIQGSGTDATIAIKNNSIGVENKTFQSGDQSVVGNNFTGGYMKGIVIDLAVGTADVTIGGANGSSDNGNEIAGHTGNGVEIGDGVKTLTVAGNYIGVVEDYDASSDKYVRDGGNGGAGVYVNSSDANLTAVTVGGTDSSYGNRIDANDVNGLHIADAGSTPATVSIQNNSFGVGQDDTTDLGNTGAAILVADGGAVTISDNAILNSSSDAVRITGSTAATLRGNRIGNNESLVAAGNGGHGVYVNSSVTTSLTIGGSTTGQGNVIAASSGDGVYVQQLASSGATVSLMGNIIGLCGDPTGGTMDTSDMSGCTNTGSGADIVYGAVTIGGDNSFGTAGDGALGAGNVISNNTEEGVKLGASVGSASILGNAIGLARGSGSFVTDAGNGRDGSSDGVEIDSAAMTTLTIGGVGLSTASSKRNVISGNDGDGVDIISVASGAAVTFYNNLIGTNWAGDTAVANGGSGVKIAGGAVTMGGSAANQGNVISGNTGYGVYMTAGSLSLLANYLGVAADGTTAMANTLNSLRVISTSSSVTGLTVGSSGSKNTINNDGVVGAYIRNVTPTNNFTMSTDNTWTDVAATTANYWERYTASTLDAYGPGGEDVEEVGGSGNHNSPSLSSSPVTTSTTTTTPTTTVTTTPTTTTTEETTTEETTTEETTITPVEEVVVQEVKKPATPAEPVVPRATEAVVENSVNQNAEVRDVAERPSIFRDRAEESTRTLTANRDAVIREFESKVEASQTTKQKVSSFLDEAIDGKLNTLQKADLDKGLEGVLAKEIKKTLTVEPGKEVMVRGVNGEKKVVNADTKVVFEPDYRKAVRLQARANATGDNAIVVTSFTDLDNDNVADVLDVALDKEAGSGDLAEDIFFKKVNLYEDPLDRVENPLFISNLPGYGATVGDETMVWVAGENEGDNYEVIVINRDTLEETLIADGELDEGSRAAVDVKFPSDGDYYVVVQGSFGKKDVVRVKVDGSLKGDLQKIELLGEQPKVSEKVASNDMFASVLLAMGIEKEEKFVGEDDRVVNGYFEPGSMVFVTWESVVLNSVVIADAGQGYFEAAVPKALAAGQHKVTVYNYNRKNARFSNVVSQLFTR